jgi:(heptosyl)LPS beta-1,4-glucosyltransferase
MRLGAYVIHGNASATLGAALQSVLAVADEVVAVDSGSTDGSAQVVARYGVRAVVHPWEGFGAARAAAVRALPGCEWLVHLDSDEWFEPSAIESLTRFKHTTPTHDAYRLGIHDWAELPGHRFLFRTLFNIRLMRRQAATWAPAMIVHESIGRPNAPRFDAFLEHHYAQTLERRRDKEDRYALLWALQASLAGKRVKPAWLEQAAHVVRNALIKGAIFRGGFDGLRLSTNAARYHSRKYEYLQQVNEGRHEPLVRALRDANYAEVFRLVGGLTT